MSRPTDQRPRDAGWDAVVRWNDRAGAWWWNAWYAATATELTGLAPSRQQAGCAMTRAITDAERARTGRADGGPG